MRPELDLDAYDYALPPERIAQEPSPEREDARLLVLERATGARHHARIRDLPQWLRGGDHLVVNATRVLPARIRGRKLSGGAAEALLLGPAPGFTNGYRALLKTRGRLRPGLKLRFGGGDAELIEIRRDGEAVLAFASACDPYRGGEAPPPPYIRRSSPRRADAERYQTTYARVPGSVAAPTAGLHLTPRLLGALEHAGIGHSEVVLHVGPGTFRPLRPEDLARRRLHPEAFELDAAAVTAITAARRGGGRIVAVGTTSTRVLEACVEADGSLHASDGDTDLFIVPGHEFRAVDALLTNFHLPRSSLLLLAAAFAGRELLLEAYAEAARAGYRFYSYGDAMLIL